MSDSRVKDTNVYDAVVIGAGIHGSATAYNLAKRGKTTLLLEQFPLLHTRGSSHGDNRITRTFYGAKDYYTLMMKDAFKLWAELEEEAGVKIYKKTGYMLIGTEDNVHIKGTKLSLQKHNVAFKTYEPEEFRKAFPMLSFPDDVGAIWDNTGGVLNANKAVHTFQELFLKHGGVIHDGEQMKELNPGDTITVVTNRATYRTKNVVLTVGPWAQKLLRQIGLDLPLKVERITMLYWKKNGNTDFVIPPFSQKPGIRNYGTYGMTSDSYPGLIKICLHHGPEVDPDERDQNTEHWSIDLMKEYVRKHFPALDPVPVIKEECMYTNTIDADFILDRHPKWNNIIIGAGFSGHGFKHGPVVGRLLCQMVLKEQTSHDLSYFRLNRFVNKSKL